MGPFGFSHNRRILENFNLHQMHIATRHTDFDVSSIFCSDFVVENKVVSTSLSSSLPNNFPISSQNLEIVVFELVSATVFSVPNFDEVDSLHLFEVYFPPGGSVISGMEEVAVRFSVNGSVGAPVSVAAVLGGHAGSGAVAAGDVDVADGSFSGTQFSHSIDMMPVSPPHGSSGPSFGQFMRITSFE
jgi:hypothetical protein